MMVMPKIEVCSKTRTRSGARQIEFTKIVEQLFGSPSKVLTQFTNSWLDHHLSLFKKFGTLCKPYHINISQSSIIRWEYER